MSESSAVKDISKLLSGGLLAKVFGVVALMVFARVLPKNELAVFPAWLTIIGIPSLFLSFGVFQTLMRKLPYLIREDYAQARSLAMTTSVVVLAGTIVVCVVALPFTPQIAGFFFHDTAEAWIVRASLLGSVAATVSKIAENVMWGEAKFGATSLVQIVESVVRPALTVVFYFLYGLEGIVAALVISQIVMAGVSFWYVRNMFLGALPPVYPLRRLFRESFPYYIDNYIWFLKGDGDTLLVAFLGPAALADYYIAKTLYNNVNLVWASFDKVAAERLARLGQLTESFRERVVEMHLRISETAVPFMMFVIALAPYGIVALAGTRYAFATWPAIALLIVALVQFLVIPIGRAVFVGLSGMYRLAASIVEATFVVSAVACLAPPFGIVGIAVARIVGPIAGGTFGYLVLRRKLGLRLSPRPVLRALAVSLPATLSVLLLQPPVHRSIDAFLGGAAAGAVWLVLFAILSYAFNRPAFDLAATFLSRRYRAVFSG